MKLRTEAKSKLKRPQGRNGRIRRWAGQALRMLPLLMATSAASAQGTITFDQSEDFASSFTKQVGTVNAEFFNPGPFGHFHDRASGLEFSDFEPNTFTLRFDQSVRWTQYDINNSNDAGNYFTFTGAGVSATAQSAETGTDKRPSTPFTFLANEDYFFAATFPSSGSFYLQNLVFELLRDRTTGQINGTSAQVGFQNSSASFRSLSQQLQSIAATQRFSGGYQPLALTMPTRDDAIALVGYQETYVASGSSVAGGSACDAQCQSRINPWGGWISGYGVGGDVRSQGGISGLDYSSGGTQLGIYRNVDRYTLLGMFGGYSNQNVDSDDGDTADIESGQVGAFLRRGDCRGDYYILAGTAAYDHYRTARDSGARGEFDGGQLGTYLERGREIQWGRTVLRPNVGLQYIWLHQDGHSETGLGAANLDGVNEHSLRALVGSSFQGPSRSMIGGNVSPYASAHWMHEFLDTTTNVNGQVGGAGFTTSGLSLGRDWAVIGTGLNYSRGGWTSLFAGYNLQTNDRQTFHAGNGGLQFAW
ncbi:autotransporter outer membrane beta-barrel domain-containing protein [Rubripirellula reticaptiva]|uniref:Autotransporter beta-domain protein n=1 Tax=Rubripirellula reticaptiva TaxID=2528013 RepID=A0A5C6F6R2_9BACT|nr:autotransporter outer membrane beta-barrel domain-containing protein [Rubripirellula reticaptiva]TWU55776.1 Autotransporter beta-domain protein [Rubripirellula reticaptiva]